MPGSHAEPPSFNVLLFYARRLYAGIQRSIPICTVAGAFRRATTLWLRILGIAQHTGRGFDALFFLPDEILSPGPYPASTKRGATMQRGLLHALLSNRGARSRRPKSSTKPSAVPGRRPRILRESVNRARHSGEGSARLRGSRGRASNPGCPNVKGPRRHPLHPLQGLKLTATVTYVSLEGNAMV
jgi:hypothetical protein